MSNQPASSSVSSLLSSRWVRVGAATVAVVGGIMAATTAVTAFAERSEPSQAPATQRVQANDHDSSYRMVMHGDDAGHHGGRHGRHGMHGGGMGAGLVMPGPRLERLLDSVKATDTQREQIRLIAEATKSDIDKLRGTGQDLRQQSMNLLTQPTVDAAAAEAIRQKMLAQHDTLSKRMMTGMLDVAKVLTPEQRAQVAERLKDMQQRKQHWFDRGHKGAHGEHHSALDEDVDDARG